MSTRLGRSCLRRRTPGRGHLGARPRSRERFRMEAEPRTPPVRPLAAFAVPNFRRFVIGQSVSLVGSWTETVAQALLVLALTHSGIWLGLAAAARYLPVLLLTPFAGLVVDRADKRTLLLVTQTSLAALSLVLGAVVLLGAIQLWMVFAVALG